MRSLRVSSVVLSLAGFLISVVAVLPALLAAPLAEDTTWSGDVLVEEATEVSAGATLRIEAGTSVRFGPAGSLVVRGRLLAMGTEEAPIVFTRSQSGVSWQGIRFFGAEESEIRHAVIEYADSEGDHKDYYDDRDSDCEPIPGARPARDYHEAIVVVASDLDLEFCTFQNLPRSGGEGDALAVISDDPVVPGTATAVIRGCEFLEIGQGVHTRYSYVLVEDCFFTGHRGDNDDVDLYGESDPPPLIRKNVFLDPEHDDMINPTRCSAIIEGNLISGSDDHGVVLRDRCDPIVVNNVIWDCSSAGIAVQNSCNALIVNNTIYDCGRGIRFFDHTGRWGLPYCLQPGSGKATVINTVIWNCPRSFDLEDSPYETDPASEVTVSYSAVEGGEGRIRISGSASAVTWGEGNIDAAPRFADAANGDFHIEVGSPLVDAGTSESAPETDFDGNARPCGPAVDIGAFELADCGPVPELFRRGDVDGEGGEDITDAIDILLYLFAGRAAPPCEKAADTNDDGAVDIADASFLLAYLFTGGAVPPPPGASCGSDPTPDELSCTMSSCR